MTLPTCGIFLHITGSVPMKPTLLISLTRNISIIIVFCQITHEIFKQIPALTRMHASARDQ